MDVSWLILLIIPNKIAGFDLFKDVFLWGYLLLKTSELSLGFSSLYFTFSVILFSSVLYFLSFSCDFILSFLYVLWNISYAWFSKFWLPKLTVVSFIFSTEVFSWLIMAFFFFLALERLLCWTWISLKCSCLFHSRHTWLVTFLLLSHHGSPLVIWSIPDGFSSADAKKQSHLIHGLVCQSPVEVLKRSLFPWFPSLLFHPQL